jgi:hypothetical protein
MPVRRALCFGRRRLAVGGGGVKYRAENGGGFSVIFALQGPLLMDPGEAKWVMYLVGAFAHFLSFSRLLFGLLVIYTGYSKTGSPSLYSDSDKPPLCLCRCHRNLPTVMRWALRCSHCTNAKAGD